MTIEDYIAKFQKLNDPDLLNAVRVPAANVLLANTKNRIIREGKATNGSTIGTYSHKPAYFPKKAFVKGGAFKPQGKSGKSKNAKTMYLPEGYFQFRGIQGRENSFVNLELSGDMMLDYQLGRTGNDIVMGFSNEQQSKKRKGNEKRFGKDIFKSSTAEIAEYSKECILGYNQVTNQILRGE